MRYTPAGIPAVEFRLQHESEREEAGAKRRINAEVAGIAFEAQARLLAKANLSTEIKLQGFLAAKSKRSKRLVLHVTDVEFIEGD